MQAINTSSLSKNFTILINADLGWMRDEPSNMYVSKTTNQLGPKKKNFFFFFYSRIRLALALSVITSEKEKSTVNLLVPFAGPAKQLENPILSSKVDPLYPPIISSRTPLSYVSSHYYAWWWWWSLWKIFRQYLNSSKIAENLCIYFRFLIERPAFFNLGQGYISSIFLMWAPCRLQ